jgi:spoIIIJ-associated protein
MEPKRSIETTGDSIQEAIEKGLAELGASPNEVIIEVLDEPSRGVFGLGARPARVRLQVIITRPPKPVESPKPEVSQTAESSQPQKRRENREPRKPRPPKPVPAQSVESYMEDQEDDGALPITEAEEVPESEIVEDVAVAREVLAELLQKMAVTARISVRRVEVTRDERSREGEAAPWLLNVTGSELNVLIGRRGETLTALQYVTRLISSRKLQRRANVIIDVDGYKMRRSQMLRGLANRMADQAVEQRRTISLEPMPPHERRIIHLTLRERADVSTKSIGEGDARKVTIVPR